jgi:IclR family transcriptional regulator, acetate operon repressor
MAGGTYKIGSLDKALRILEEIAESPGRTLAEISRSLDAPRAGVFRHLKALEALGYVVTSPDSKRYVLGPRLIYLGVAARSQMRLADVARPAMVALRDEFNETVNMGVLARGEVIHVEVVPSTHPVKMAVQVGEWTYCHCSALGKVLLAWSEPEVAAEAIRERGLPALTDRTVQTPRELASALETVRSAGFAIDDEESSLGLRCVAAAVRDGTGKVVAAISLSSPADRLAKVDALRLAPRIISAAGAVSRRLGWFGDDGESTLASQQFVEIGR